MVHESSPHPAAQRRDELSALTIYTARRIHTLDETLPQATAVAVAGGRIVAVGDLDSMALWRSGRAVTVDTRFAHQVLLPGLIDNHLHPFLGALLMPTAHIAPEAWRQPDGQVREAARTPQEYRHLLLARAAEQSDPHALFVSFGYQPRLHGDHSRAVLNALFPERPVVLIQRSFHESFLNDRALEFLGLSQELTEGHPQTNWARGHFYETGNKLVLTRLLPHWLNPQWYDKGLRMTAQLMHQGGITTAADMAFGLLNPEYEVAALRRVLEGGRMPLRVLNVFDVRSFANRALGQEMGPPHQPIDFVAGLAACEPWLARGSAQVGFARAIKLFADGAFFSQLMRMNPPGFSDGHEGEWLMAPEILKEGLSQAWRHGWQAHVHVTGDAGMDALLDGLANAQAEHPRFDHRLHAHHVGFHTPAQSARLAALGGHASLNPYYLHALGPDYAEQGLGPERAAQLVRSACLLRAGSRVSLHSDFMMAPTEPLFLAWCAATRRIRGGGAVASPTERLSLMQALRAITIDAAWALGLDAHIGSIRAGKRADFCVLQDDPFELGAERLNEVRVAGTVFEGQPHLLAQPLASLHGSLLGAGRAVAQSHALTAGVPVRRSLWGQSALRARCAGRAVEICELGQRWASWLRHNSEGMMQPWS